MIGAFPWCLSASSTRRAPAGQRFFQVSSKQTEPQILAVGTCPPEQLQRKCEKTLVRWIDDDAFYFRLISSFLRERGSEDALVVDVGGNHGFYTAYAAKLGYMVHYFEPQPSLCTRACLAMVANNLSVQVSFFTAGVGRSRTTAEIMSSEGLAYAGGACTAGATADRCMQVYSLDSIYSAVKAARHQFIALLKLDNEGWELPVLQGATRLLAQTIEVSGQRRARVGSLFVEIVPGRWLERSGLSVSQGTEVLAGVVRLGYVVQVVTKDDDMCPHALVPSAVACKDQPFCATVVAASEVSALMERMTALDTTKRPGQWTCCNFWLTHESWQQHDAR